MNIHISLCSVLLLLIASKAISKECDSKRPLKDRSLVLVRMDLEASSASLDTKVFYKSENTGEDDRYENTIDLDRDDIVSGVFALESRDKIKRDEIERVFSKLFERFESIERNRKAKDSTIDYVFVEGKAIGGIGIEGVASPNHLNLKPYTTVHNNITTIHLSSDVCPPTPPDSPTTPSLKLSDLHKNRGLKLFSSMLRACKKMAASSKDFKWAGLCGGVAAILNGVQSVDQFNDTPWRTFVVISAQFLREAIRFVDQEDALKGYRSMIKVLVTIDRSGRDKEKLDRNLGVAVDDDEDQQALTLPDSMDEVRRLKIIPVTVFRIFHIGTRYYKWNKISGGLGFLLIADEVVDLSYSSQEQAELHQTYFTYQNFRNILCIALHGVESHLVYKNQFKDMLKVTSLEFLLIGFLDYYFLTND